LYKLVRVGGTAARRMVRLLGLSGGGQGTNSGRRGLPRDGACAVAGIFSIFIGRPAAVLTPNTHPHVRRVRIVASRLRGMTPRTGRVAQIQNRHAEKNRCIDAETLP